MSDQADKAAEKDGWGGTSLSFHHFCVGIEVDDKGVYFGTPICMVSKRMNLISFFGKPIRNDCPENERCAACQRLAPMWSTDAALIRSHAAPRELVEAVRNLLDAKFDSMAWWEKREKLVSVVNSFDPRAFMYDKSVPRGKNRNGESLECGNCRCDLCGNTQEVSWAVRSELWNSLIRDNGVAPRDYVCLDCFIRYAEDRSVSLQLLDFVWLACGDAILIDRSALSAHEPKVCEWGFRKFNSTLDPNIYINCKNEPIVAMYYDLSAKPYCPYCGGVIKIKEA